MRRKVDCCITVIILIGISTVAFSHRSRFCKLSQSHSKETMDNSSTILVSDPTVFFFSVRFSPQQQEVAAADSKGVIYLYDLDAKGLKRIAGHKEPIHALGFTQDGRFLLSGSWDRSVKVWDVRTCKEVNCFAGPFRSGVAALAVHPTESVVAIGCGAGDGIVRLWSLSSGLQERSLIGHKDGVEGIAFSHNGKRIATASIDGTIRIWNFKDGKHILTLVGHTNSVTCVAFSPDDTRLASGSADETVRIWDILTGKTIQLFTGISGGVNCINFAIEGTLLCIGSGETRNMPEDLRCWDMRSGQLSLTLHGHSDAIRSFDYSANRALGVTGSEDGTVRLWDFTQIGRELKTRSQKDPSSK